MSQTYVRDAGVWKPATQTEQDEGVVFSRGEMRYQNQQTDLDHTHGSLQWGRMFYEPTGIIVEENCRYEVRMDCDMDLGNSMKGGGGGNYYWRYNLQFAASDLHGHYVWAPAKFQGSYDWSTDYVLHGWQHVDWTSNAMGVQRNGATMPVGSEIHGEIWIKGLQNGGTLVFRNLHFDLTVHRWRMVDDVWVRDGGQWKRATEIQVRSGGAWRV